MARSEVQIVPTLTLTTHNRELRNDATSETVTLSHTTTKMFVLLATHQSKTVTHEVIQRVIWGDTEKGGTIQNVNNYIFCLRRDLASVSIFDAVINIKRIGYMLDIVHKIKIVDTSLVNLDLNECTKCDLPECVEVDSTIDKSWCRLNLQYKEVKLVSASKRKWRFSRPKESTLRAIEKIINNNKKSLSISQLVAATPFSDLTIESIVNTGYIETKRAGRKNFVTGVNYEPTKANNHECTFNVLQENDSFFVSYKPEGTKTMKYCFESTNAYLAIAAIAMEMAKKYGEIIE